MRAFRGMNSDIEFAQKSTGLITAKQALYVTREASTWLSLAGQATPDRETGSGSYLFELRAADKKNGIERIISIVIPGSVSNVGELSYRPVNGTWALVGATQNFLDILELLPSEASIAFEVILDAFSTETHTVKEMHGDAVYLVAEFKFYGKVKQRRFLLDVSTGEHGTARFGGGK